MTRKHYSSRQGMNHRTMGTVKRVATRGPEKQARVMLGNRAVFDRTIAKWDAGTAEIEEKMAKHRAKTHTFVPMGRLPACEKCGVDKDAVINGKRVHRAG